MHIYFPPTRTFLWFSQSVRGTKSVSLYGVTCTACEWRPHDATLRYATPSPKRRTTTPQRNASEWAPPSLVVGYCSTLVICGWKPSEGCLLVMVVCLLFRCGAGTVDRLGGAAN